MSSRADGPILSQSRRAQNCSFASEYAIDTKDRELSRWQRAAELLLGEADVGASSKQVELALFYDAKLDLAK